MQTVVVFVPQVLGRGASLVQLAFQSELEPQSLITNSRTDGKAARTISETGLHERGDGYLET